MVCEYVLSVGYSTNTKGYYSLEQTIIRRVGTDPYGNQLGLFSPWIPKKTRSNIGQYGNFIFPEIYYGAIDVESTYRVHKVQLELIDKWKMEKTMILENEFTLVLGDMELNGMPVDLDEWMRLAEWSKEEYERCLEDLKSKYPEVLNWNSPAQVNKLFKAIGINTIVKDKVKSKKQGKDIYKESVQEIVIKDQAKDFPIIDEYLRYKGIYKVNSNYGIKFLKHVSPITNRIHSSFMQIMNTGRTSSTNPNMQNIINAKEDFPEGIWWREAFKTQEGRTLIICDYTSQELHVLADQSQEQYMLEALRSKQDLHSLTASKMYKTEVSKKINSHLRPLGKKLNFTIPYGGGVHKIASEFKLPMKEAQVLYDNFYEGYPALKPHFEKIYKKSLSDGFITVDKFGRKFFLSELREVERLLKIISLLGRQEDRKKLRIILEQIRRNCQNYCIQGTSASISKLAGILLRRKLKGTSARVLLLIHDEWVVECDEADSASVATVVEQCMKEAAEALCESITIPAEAVISNCWNKS